MPNVSSDSELARQEVAAEQAFVDVVYERLEASAVTAQSLVAEGMARGHVGNEGGLVERDAMVYQASRRLSALNAAHDGLVFGRLDLIDGQARYVGRIGVRDADRDVLLVDWRAPAASLFYQATASEPAGVVRRRVLRCSGETVLGVEDDLLDADAAGDDLIVVGEGALLASLSRARDDRMHSVVATIQKEQDEAIRAPRRGATVIGGGPGTGKTVVALHRAAYLLYNDRRRFESGGVLVVGPSKVFMHYIDRVLPSLGETSVTLRAIGEVVDGIRATRHDPPEVAAVKGSARMVAFLRRLAASPVHQPPREFSFFYRDEVVRLDAAGLERLRRRLMSGAQHNVVLPQVRRTLARELWTQLRFERALELGEQAFTETLIDSEKFERFVDEWWPQVDAVSVWRTVPDRLGELGQGAFSRAEIEAVRRAWTDDDPSIEDVPIIDDLRHRLGEVPAEHVLDGDDPKQLMSFERREREQLRATGSIADDGFAHVLIDEAQDLSPMQWRMLGRRGRYASWTIVGDAAQSSWPDPAEATRARERALEGMPVHRFRLSTNYRNAAEVYELAGRVATRTIERPDLPDAVRRTGEEPRHVTTTDLDAAVLAQTRELLARVEGSVAVVAARERVAGVGGLLADVAGADDRLRVLDGLDTKGLEFDAVLVVEPDEIVAESAAGWRTLYVVLTRATQLLTTVGTTRDWLDSVG